MKMIGHHEDDKHVVCLGKSAYLLSLAPTPTAGCLSLQSKERQRKRLIGKIYRPMIPSSLYL